MLGELALVLAGVAAGAAAVLFWLGRGPVAAPAPAPEPPRAPEPPPKVAPLADPGFLGFLAHAFRTPLTAIIGYSEMLQEDAVILEQNDFVPDLKQIRKAGEHLLALVDDVVDHCRIQAGDLPLRVEVVDVARLVRDVESATRPLVNRTLGTLDVRVEDGGARTDRAVLERALVNLVRHVAGLGGNSKLSLVARREGDDLVFALSAGGLALDEAQVRELLADVAAAEQGGLPAYHGAGLGLALAHEFARVLGGGLRIGQDGRGTVFTLWVPAER